MGASAGGAGITATPARPDEPPWVGRPHARWWPTSMVAVAILVTTLGGWVAAAALVTPAGPPVGLTGVVSVQPLSGWQDAGRHEVAGAPFVRLTRGGGNLDVVAVVPFSGTNQQLGDAYVDRVLRSQLDRLSVSRRTTSVVLAGGSRALRFTYVGVVSGTSQSIDGEVTVAVGSRGNGVVFDAWAPEGLLSFVEGDQHTMVFRAVVA
jgi:hypothetical protein